MGWRKDHATENHKRLTVTESHSIVEGVEELLDGRKE